MQVSRKEEQHLLALSSFLHIRQRTRAIGQIVKSSLFEKFECKILTLASRCMVLVLWCRDEILDTGLERENRK